MRKIAVVTSGRWDYGHLFWIMHDIEASGKLELQIIAPENHHEISDMAIKLENSPIFKTRPVKSIHDTGAFCHDVLCILEKTRPDIVLVLGDRFEIFAAATAATLLNIPIAHIHGGETTEGAFDNALRNSITMLATWHFTAHDKYAEKVADMTTIKEYKNCLTNTHKFWNLCEGGYYPFYDPRSEKDMTRKVKIFNVGAPGLDWITRTKLYSKQELQKHVGIDLNEPFILACFQPVTRELENTAQDMDNFLLVLGHTKRQVLLIRPNCDPGSDMINDLIDKSLGFSTYRHIKTVENLDHLTYLSLMQYAKMMVGNSSSGMIEAASFNLPAINVGTRQNGRIKNANVFNCGYDAGEILSAMDRAMAWYAVAEKCENVYGDGHAAERIVKVLEEV